ncbi:MAG TPA: transposase [Candidatus Acidoferrum sp.]|nr:transposase [Candidatus Acidoferrum sp.]
MAELIVKELTNSEENGLCALQAWVVMPNHVHVLFEPQCTLGQITQAIKGRSARKANLLLGRTGKYFWQDESFDHWIRDEAEFAKVKKYIERNPVVAGLVAKEADWRWSSATAGSCR